MELFSVGRSYGGLGTTVPTCWPGTESGRAAVTLGTLVAAGALMATASGVMARPLRGSAEALAVMARAVWGRPLVVMGGWGTGPT